MSEPTASQRDAQLERSLGRYTVYLVLRETWFWMPVFFLYFSARLPLAQVLWLEAAYYLSVVLLEVPSGWASDRWGRKPTLLISSVCLLAAYLLFTISGPLPVLLSAQVLLAASIALASGTDTSLHHDTLRALGREPEYGPREARLGKLGAWAMAAGALGGGAIAALWGTRWAYGASLLTAAAMVVVCLGLVEPVDRPRGARPAEQLGRCLEQLRLGWLRWLFGFAVVSVVLNHLPYEFYQGYVALSLGELTAEAGRWAPLVAGVHVAMSATLAGWAAGQSVHLAERLGVRLALLASATAQVVLVAAMALWLHPVVVALLLLRGVPGALQRAPLRTAIAPHVPSSLRATYLSLQSLGGRLAFAATLGGLGLVSAGGGEALDWGTLSTTLAVACGWGGVLVATLVLWRGRNRGQR